MAAVKVKTKISVGLVFLFVLIVLLSVVGGYSIKKLESDVGYMLKHNYEDIGYTQNIVHALDQIDYLLEDSMRTSVNAYKAQLHVIEQNLSKQEKRALSEKEIELTKNIRRQFEEYRYMVINSQAKRKEAHRFEYSLKDKLFQLKDYQMAELRNNNNKAQEDAKKGFNMTAFLGTLCFMITIVFIFSFPEYIASPIRELTESIKKIADHNYEERLQYKSDDEFGELSNAFNTMAEKLDQYEHSSLAKLTFEKNRINMVVDKMSDAIIGIDEDDYILFVNKEAEEILGVDDKSIVGKHAPEIARFNEIFRKMMLNKNNEDFTIKLFADGKETYYAQEVIELDAEQGGEEPQTLGYVFILKNVTKYEEHDQATMDYVKTATRKLQKPINAIQQQVKVIERENKDKLTETETEALEKLKDEVEKLQKIKQEFQSLQLKAEDDDDNMMSLYQLIPPRDIVEYAYNTMAIQAEQREITLELHYEFDLPKINADLEKTTWVLVMFISNALRYSTNRNRIVITAELNEEKTDMVFSVQDFGKGIPTEVRDKLFEKYFPTASMSKTQSGTGLAMSVAKELIEEQSGKIWVESTAGEGSTFYFSLPCAY